MLFGHVDASGVLVAPPPKTSSKTMLQNMFTLFAPFDHWLWLCLVCMIVGSGVVDWVLEYPGGRLKSSVYEYAAGVLWGGFADPGTNLSAIFQVINALAIMIIVAAYTANLAAFLVVRPEASISFGSTRDLVQSQTSVCSVGSYASQAKLNMSYDLAFDTLKTGFTHMGEGLLNGQCEAAIFTKVDFDSLIAGDGTMCELSTVGMSLYYEAGGWVTNLENSLCIQRPIEYALHVLQARTAC